MTTMMITAMGAVTSVGLNAITSCASIRAGLSRPTMILEHPVLDREEQAPVGVTGHPIPLVAGGFTGVGRWLQLAALALEDLCRSGGLPGPDCIPFWSTTDCTVVVPILDGQRFEMEPACASENTIADRLLAPLAQRVAPYIPLWRPSTWCHGRVGVLEVVQLATEQLRCRQCDRVLVLAVDSLTDGTGLSWLADHGRLKHDDNPVGLAPGEGAVAFLLEAPWAARARRASVLGHVEAVASVREPIDSDASEHRPGEDLARVVEAVLVTSGAPLPYTAETMTDLNGEQWRATEYGHAQVRVPKSAWDGDAVELPAASVGDMGTAMTALQLVLAARSLQRGYATGDHVLLTACDEYGRVGAAMLGRGAHPPSRGPR